MHQEQRLGMNAPFTQTSCLCFPIPLHIHLCFLCKLGPVGGCSGFFGFFRQCFSFPGSAVGPLTQCHEDAPAGLSVHAKVLTSVQVEPFTAAGTHRSPPRKSELGTIENTCLLERRRAVSNIARCLGLPQI
jgi:hypothetical protein